MCDANSYYFEKEPFMYMEKLLACRHIANSLKTLLNVLE